MNSMDQSEAHLYDALGLSDEANAKKAMLKLLKNLSNDEKPSHASYLFNHFIEFLIDMAIVMALGAGLKLIFNLIRIELVVVCCALLISLTIARMGLAFSKRYIENCINQINTQKSIAVAIWAIHSEKRNRDV